MEIETGLFDHMVVQRGRDGAADARFTGACGASGVLMVRVTRGGKTVRGFKWRPAGRARDGRFAGRLKHLPVGGPYTVELRIETAAGKTPEHLRIRDVLVGDVWILAGQSNMQGIGLLRDAERPHRMVRAHYMDDRWDVARDPIHNIHAALDPVHGAGAPGAVIPQDVKTGVGPGVSFARWMHRTSAVPQGLIACAHGGTSMSQWNPKYKRLGGRSLYGAMVRRFVRNGGRVAGVVWYQGESDAHDRRCAELYTRRMKTLIRAMRRDFGDPKLPVAIVQIARVIGWPAESAANWNSIQDQQRRLPDAIDRLAVVPAIDLELDDTIHISGRAQRRLGRRLAGAMTVLTRADRAAKGPIKLRRIRLDPHPFHGPAEIIVEYDNVIGALRAPGRPMGFSLDGALGGGISHVALRGSHAVLRSAVPFNDLGEMSLHYGAGMNPCCNITDAADRSLPVMGPVPVARPRAQTPFISELSVSELQPSAGKLESLGPPESLAALGFGPRRFQGVFCNLHEQLGPLAPRDVVVYFACRLRCRKAMRLTAWLGYDGPVKVWVDGRQLFYDPAGVNPALPTDAEVPFSAAAGEHNFVVALGSNHGLAWGISLRFEHRGVSAAALAKGPAHYELPEVSPLA